MINIIKNFIEKNNYLGLKITGTILVAAIALIAVVLITSNDKGLETSAGGNETSRNVAEATTDDIKDTETISNMAETTSSSKEVTTVVGEQSLSEEYISTNDVALGDSGTTTKQDETESKKQEQTTTKVVTTQKPTTTKQETTQKQTTTQKETTTQEETTTAPPRGANGVILEELVCNRVSDSYALPKTYQEIKDSGADAKLFHYLRVPDTLNQNVFGNEILLYNSDNGKGSIESNVISIYGEALYRYVRTDTGAICLIYKYLPFGEDNKQDLYMRFAFSKDKEYKLIGITLTSFDELKTDTDFNP